MTNNLYLEAIEAAEEIKQTAEEKVKQRLIESMTPQIKLLVEKKLFEEEILQGQKSNSEKIKNPDEENKDKVQSDNSDSKEEEELSSQIEESRIKNILVKNANHTKVFLKLQEIKKGLISLKKAKALIESENKSIKENKKFMHLYKLLLREIKNLKSNSIIKNNDDLLKEFYIINKEINNMSRRQLQNELDYLLEMNLFEDEEVLDDEEDSAADDMSSDDMSGMDDMDDMDDMVAGDDDDDDAEDLDSATSALQQIIDIAEEALGEEDDMKDEDSDELQLDDSLFEADAAEGMCDTTLELTDEVEANETYLESYDRDRVLEIDENMLRREIGRMKTLREGEAKDMASHFGGGSLEGEAFVDGVVLNKLHEVKSKAAKVLRKNRMLESKLSQYKKALRGMKGQLQEMNLFNAKLLYANKLMQNRDLSIKQQRHIVESLDEVNTLDEAKTLFESLSKSLVSKTAKNSENLTEGTARRLSGSSSAPVRSAQPLNESVALDRWATLAGIKK